MVDRGGGFVEDGRAISGSVAAPADPGKRRTFTERPIADVVERGAKNNGVQYGATGKGRPTDISDAVGDGDGSECGASEEGEVANGRDAVGDRDMPGDSSGTRNQCREGFVEKDTVVAGVIKIVF